MYTELAILSPLLVLYYFDIVGWEVIVLIMFTWYWLPKWLFLNSFLDIFYPNIITRNRNIKLGAYKPIALTFDDAPYGSHERIITLLDLFNMKGTFFIISSYVNKENMQVFVNAVKNGHQLANHGKTNRMHALLSEDALVNEMYHCDQLINEIYDEAKIDSPKQMYYRPGCGLFTNSMLKIVDDAGYKLALASVYPNDPIVRFRYIELYIS